MSDKEQEKPVDEATTAEETAETTTTTKRKRKRKRKNNKPEGDDAGADNEKNNDGTNTQQDMVHCTVYVEGIPFDAKPDDVKHFFISNGISAVVELRLPTWQDSGRLRGYGHVVFENTKDYDAALELSGKHMGQRYLTIQPSKTPKEGGGCFPTGEISTEPPTADCKTVFVHNLPYGAVEEEIATAFEKFGRLSSVGGGVRIARNYASRQSKGFCYVDFEEPQSAEEAVKASAKRRITVGGRIVRVDYDEGRIKGSFRTQSGRLWSKEVKEDEQQQQGKEHGGDRQKRKTERTN